MSLRKSSRLAVAFPFVVLAAYGAIAAQPSSVVRPQANPACQASSDTVRTGQTNATVNVRYTEEIGDTLSATIADGAKIIVNSARKGATPMTAELLINTEQAAVGEWSFSLNGNRGTCSGLITVSATKKK